MRRLTIPAVPLLIACTIALGGFAAGCGATEEVGERAAEKAIEEQTGGDADIDVDKDGKGSVTFKDKDGNETKVDAGGGTDLPDGWPDELAMPDGAKVILASTNDTAQGAVSTVSATTSDSVKEVAAHFDDQLSKWKQENKMDMGTGDEQVATRNYSNDGQSVILTIGSNSSSTEDPTTISISLTKE